MHSILMNMTRKFFSLSNKVVFSEGTFYYRQDNSNAITKNFSVKNFYTLNTLFKLYNLLKENNVAKQHLQNVQFKLLNDYFIYKNQCKTFNFRNMEIKKNIEDFLLNFEKEYLMKIFLRKNLKLVLLKLKIQRKIRAIFNFKKPSFC